MNIMIVGHAMNAHTELQCLYLHKVKECECLAEKLSKQTKNVSKEVYNGLLRSFAKLEKQSISLELALKQCQEQLKMNTFTRNASRDLHENDLLTGNRGSDLYTISLQETTSSTPICFMAKASPTQASVNKSSSPSVNSQQQDTQPTVNIHPTTEPITPTRIFHVEETNDNQAEDAHFEPYEFVNPFCTPIQELAESSSRNVDNSNMHTFYQCHQSER
ncbi:hypothetical protein Tco_1300546 [Tanacetum coccineum]